MSKDGQAPSFLEQEWRNWGLGNVEPVPSPEIYRLERQRPDDVETSEVERARKENRRRQQWRCNRGRKR